MGREESVERSAKVWFGYLVVQVGDIESTLVQAISERQGQYSTLKCIAKLTSDLVGLSVCAPFLGAEPTSSFELEEKWLREG